MTALINTLTSIEFTTEEWFTILDALGWWNMEGHHKESEQISEDICLRLDGTFKEYGLRNPDVAMLAMEQELERKNP